MTSGGHQQTVLLAVHGDPPSHQVKTTPEGKPRPTPQRSFTDPASRIMKRDPITVSPDTPTLEAIRAMRRHRVACVPVVRGDKLVGILTERDLIEVAAQLLEDHLAGLGALEPDEE